MEKIKRESRIEAVSNLYLIDMGNFKKENIEDEFVLNIVNIYLEQQEKINNLISSSLTNYRLERLPFVTRSIIRLATIEMLNGLDPKIAINEALEIVKIYVDSGDKKDVRFVNKVLDNIKNNMR